MISGGRISEKRAMGLFNKADKDSSGVIDYEEFKQVRRKKMCCGGRRNGRSEGIGCIDF